MAKHILFVGDLRNAENYGAIATTESLCSLISLHYPNVDVKSIDFRSMQQATPPSGWDIAATQAKQQKGLVRRLYLYFRRFVKKSLKFFLHLLLCIIPYGIVRYYKNQKEKRNKYNASPIMDYHVPFKYADYAMWEKDYVDGKVLQYEKNLLEWADVVVVNGEGNFVHGVDKNGVYRRRSLYLFFISWIAKKVHKKPTYMVNHVVDVDSKDAIEIIKQLYPILDGIIVRDPISLSVLENYGISGAEYMPDALFSYQSEENWRPSAEISKQIDFSKPYILVGDSSGFMNEYGRVSWNVPYYMVQLIQKLQNVIPQVVFVDGFNSANDEINYVINKTHIGYVNLLNCSWKDLYHVMRHADIFISGRWHASIISILAGTPILCWGADSHKTKALYPIMDYPYKFFETASLPLHLDELAQEASVIISNRDRIRKNFREKVKTLSKLSHKNVTCFETL